MSARLVRFVPAPLPSAPAERVATLPARLLTAREETLNDVELWQSGLPLPPDRQPLDAGFIQWPEELLLDLEYNRAHSLVGRIEACAAELRAAVDAVVVLGDDSSVPGLKSLCCALQPADLSVLNRAAPRVPRMYVDGLHPDAGRQADLLQWLPEHAGQAAEHPAAEGRTALIVISRSGETLDTSVAFQTCRQLIERRCAAEAAALIVPITARTGRLRDLAEAAGYRDVFSIPDGIGERFSVFTAAGLLPAAVAGLNIRALLQGAADITQHFRAAAAGQNAVLDYVAAACLTETDNWQRRRRLTAADGRLESLDAWYQQLQGLPPGAGAGESLFISLVQNVGGQTSAAVAGATPALVLPAISEHALGQLLQLLMLATVVEGRLLGRNPYGPPAGDA